MAEICREYLNNDDISSRAVVAYPVENGVTDLTQGIVLELKDVEGNVCGGSVSWTDDYEFTYTASTSATITRLYIDGDGNIATTVPDSPATISVSSLTIRDNRTSPMQEYAICKVGRVYWMGENLAATTYRDGTSISLKTELDGTAGYFLSSDGEHYFYNGEALVAGDLAPEGWVIPTTDDWSNLVTYTGGTAAIKTGSWSSSNIVGTDVTDVTNLSYMSITANGQIGPTFRHEGDAVTYWTVDENGEIITSTKSIVGIIGDSDEIYWVSPIYSSDTNYYKGFSLRCIME